MKPNRLAPLFLSIFVAFFSLVAFNVSKDRSERIGITLVAAASGLITLFLNYCYARRSSHCSPPGLRPGKHPKVHRNPGYRVAYRRTRFQTRLSGARHSENAFRVRTFYRGVEAFTQNTFGVSLYQMRMAYADVGAGKANQVLVWQNRMDSKPVFLTADR